MSVSSPSGRRLGAAVLGYLVVATLLITWAPFDFAAVPRHGLTRLWTWSDVLLNVVMFLPLGFLFEVARSRAGRDVSWRRALLDAAGAGALLSVVIETGQLFLAGRYTSPVDVATNTAGAVIGALALRAVRPRLLVDSGTVRALALDVPLAGVIVLLVPLVWTGALGQAEPGRLALYWLLAVTGGVLIGSVHGSYLAAATRGSTLMAAAAAAAWLLISALPALLRVGTAGGRWLVLGACLLASALAAHRSAACARARQRHGAQRVETAALRLAMPPFAAYVTISALWPLTSVDGLWRAAWTLAPAAESLSRGLILESLAHLAAFTVVGYVTAEWHGRTDGRFVEAWPRVLRRVAPLAILLEWARGWNATLGASVALCALALLSGLFGGWLYHLQRAHVQALRARPRTPSVAAQRASSSSAPVAVGSATT
jgi:glycopeptide antibiotics resistance protein